MRDIARRDDIHDLILDGVDVLLARYGFKKMTMEDLARQVGIGKGTIYLHFRSKEELTLSHIDRIAERLLDRLEALAGSAAPPDDRVRKMLAERVLYRFDSVTHYSQSLNDLLSSVRKNLLARRQVHFEKEAAVLERVLRDGVRRGVLACPDPASAAHVLVWSTNSLLPFSLTTRELGKRKEMEERVSRIADVLLRGLIRRSARPSTRTQKPECD